MGSLSPQGGLLPIREESMQRQMEITGVIKNIAHVVSPKGTTLVKMVVEIMSPYCDAYGNCMRKDQRFTIVTDDVNCPLYEEKKDVTLTVQYKHLSWFSEHGTLMFRTVLAAYA